MVEIKGNGFSYSLEDRLVKKLDLMIARCIQPNPKRDAVLANEGGEGEGKSNSSVAEAYYVHLKTRRPVHIFFKLRNLIDFAKKTEKKIIIWDEPSLDSLTGDHMKRINADLRRLLMTARKKRHFLIINWVKFWKFEEYIQVDRCLGMVHMYSRKETEAGRFFYIPKRNLEPLRNDYNSKHKRNYKLYRSFGGKFPDIMEKHFDKMGFHVEDIPNATYKDYEEQKDKAILSIGDEDSNKGLKEKKLELELKNLKYLISKINPKEIETKEQLAKAIRITPRMMREWAKYDYIDPYSLAKRSLGEEAEANIINSRGLLQESDTNDGAEEADNTNNYDTDLPDDLDDDNNDLNDDENAEEEAELDK